MRLYRRLAHVAGAERRCCRNVFLPFLPGDAHNRRARKWRARQLLFILLLSLARGARVTWARETSESPKFARHLESTGFRMHFPSLLFLCVRIGPGDAREAAFFRLPRFCSGGFYCPSRPLATVADRQPVLTSCCAHKNANARPLFGWRDASRSVSHPSTRRVFAGGEIKNPSAPLKRPGNTACIRRGTIGQAVEFGRITFDICAFAKIQNSSEMCVCVCVGAQVLAPGRMRGSLVSHA